MCFPYLTDCPANDWKGLYNSIELFDIARDGWKKLEMAEKGFNSELGTLKFPVFPFLKPNGITQSFEIL